MQEILHKSLVTASRRNIHFSFKTCMAAFALGEKVFNILHRVFNMANRIWKGKNMHFS